MTELKPQASDDQGVSSSSRLPGRFNAALRRARLAMLWEGLWPPLAALATVLGFFLAASWLGLWLWLPPVGRAIGLCLFGLLALAALFPVVWVRWPGKAEGLKRLDRNSGVRHRPATAAADKLAVTHSDPMSAALWQAHVERAEEAAREVKAGWPSPQMPLRDPFAIRALAAVLVVATFVAAGGDRTRRVMAAFNWQGVVAPANYRIDAWITPPPYTARPPVILAGLRPGEPARASAPVSVPAKSVLVIRATGVSELDLVVKGGLQDEKSAASAPAAAGTEERRFVITDSGQVTLRGIGNDVTWSFTAIPDRAPTIALTKDPDPQLRGSLQLSYKLEDDYGVVDAQATFARKETANTIARPLFGPPEMPLVLPQPRTRNGAGQTTKDLSEHPWAGVDVMLTLRARDEAGNEGLSDPFAMRLPERVFTKPLARALIEQRRNLALDANAKAKVIVALDALAIAPEKFTPEIGVYLGLRSIFWQLTLSKSDDALREVVDRLWKMAVNIEDGNVSDAEAALRAAQDALRQALERGASDEEIKKLMDDLRAALDKFMQALAEQMQRNPNQQMSRADPNMRMLRPQDLKNMLDRMENLARSGARDAARRMLDELQSMLENLQTARPGNPMDGEMDDDMMSALDELGDMIRKQQQLRDRTYRQGQDERRQQRGQRGERGQQGEQGEQSYGDLRQNQQALRDQLKKLLEQLRQRGMGQQQPGEQGDGGMDQLGRAGEAMGDAESQLGDGNADGAVNSQGRALEALRRGAQGMAQAMQQQGMGEGPGQPGRQGQARAQQETDPLGRPLRGRDYGDDVTVKVPGEIDVQRARRILEELRRRFADPLRPQLELDYIERLLRDF